MGVEIERKYLLHSDAWRADAGPGERVCQGYLVSSPTRTVRVRRVGDVAFLTIKGPRLGIARSEFEYRIPVADAEQMLRDLCTKPLVEKTRYRVTHFGVVWEIDDYGPDHGGLVIAEIELKTSDEPVSVPAWIGQEVTEDRRYRNSMIAEGGRRRVDQPAIASWARAAPQD